MASLKEVRIRISSVMSTKQITSAMKMVSASKLRRAQTAIIKLRPYSKKLNEILANLKNSVENSDEAIYFAKRKENNVLLIVLTSNRGLCGAFNSNTIKLTSSLISGKYREQAQNGNLSLLCIGKVGYDYFNRRKVKIAGNYSSIYDGLTYDKTVEISTQLMKDFVAGVYDRIELVYGQFKNASTQILVNEQYLPIAPSDRKETSARADYIFEPGKVEIVSELIPKTLKIQFYKAILDSWASEHGARMTAMHKATDNADSLLKDLKLTYNKARQASITTEILEIISGANALKG